jgi:hypothetical protein
MENFDIANIGGMTTTIRLEPRYRYGTGTGTGLEPVQGPF